MPMSAIFLPRVNVLKLCFIYPKLFLGTCRVKCQVANPIYLRGNLGNQDLRLRKPVTACLAAKEVKTANVIFGKVN